MTILQSHLESDTCQTFLLTYVSLLLWRHRSVLLLRGTATRGHQVTHHASVQTSAGCGCLHIYPRIPAVTLHRILVQTLQTLIKQERLELMAQLFFTDRKGR